MKKNIIFAAAFAMITLNVFAQHDAAIKGSVSKRFSEMFPDATSVAWTTLRNDVAKAQFCSEGVAWLAFFDGNANLIASGRKVKHDDSLPLEVTRSIGQKKARLERKYGDLAILHTFEMINNGVTKYYSTLGNEEVSVVISASPSGYAILERTEMKNETPQIRPGPANVIAKKSAN